MSLTGKFRETQRKNLRRLKVKAKRSTRVSSTKKTSPTRKMSTKRKMKIKPEPKEPVPKATAR